MINVYNKYNVIIYIFKEKGISFLKYEDTQIQI